MSVYVRVCVCGVSVCVCAIFVNSSTNLSSIQTFHVLKGQMPGLGQMWGPVMIFTCQIVSNPRLRPGMGEASHVEC